jgi:hypothetical protein
MVIQLIKFVVNGEYRAPTSIIRIGFECGSSMSCDTLYIYIKLQQETVILGVSHLT